MTPQQRVQAGAVLLCAGSWLLYQGYEGAGRKRPWFTRLFPGA